MGVSTIRSWWLRGIQPLGGPRTDAVLAGGRIVDVGPRARQAAPPGATAVDAEGLVLLPGLVDLHTHLREPGDEASETIETATAAAAAGGYSVVHAMPNTTPPTDTAPRAEALAKACGRRALVDVAVVGAVTLGRAGAEVVNMAALAASAASVRMFSDDGSCVADAAVMRQALYQAGQLGVIVAQHAQEPSLTVGAQVNERRGTAALPGWPPVAESVVVARDCLLARDTGARLHVCHVSCAETVEVLRWAKALGVEVTAEVTPHHLFLNDDSVLSEDPTFKVNPPLRSTDDVEALREALVDGTIDAVATDHAPHMPARKSRTWLEAPPGMLGLEHALAVVITALVVPGRLTWAQLAQRMAVTPALIGGLGHHGRPVAADEPATVTLVDPNVVETVAAGATLSRSRNDPYVGQKLQGQVMATFLRGSVVYTGGDAARRGLIADPPSDHG